MGMTKPEVINLLAVITAYDNRTVGEVDVAAWAKTAELANWSYAEATEAVHEHFAFDPNYLTQALLTARIRDNRRERMSRDVPAQLASRRIPQGIDYEWGRSNSPELEELHRMACAAMPWCTSCKSTDRCVTSTGLATKIPCLPRITAARHAGW